MTTIRPWNAICENAHARCRAWGDLNGTNSRTSAGAQPVRKPTRTSVWLKTTQKTVCGRFHQINTSAESLLTQHASEQMFIKNKYTRVTRRYVYKFERSMTNSWWIHNLCRSAHSAKCAERFRSTIAEMRTGAPYCWGVPSTGVPFSKIYDEFLMNTTFLQKYAQCEVRRSISQHNCRNAHRGSVKLRGPVNRGSVQLRSPSQRRECFSSTGVQFSKNI